MATLYVTEFASSAAATGDGAQVANTPKVAQNNVTIGGSTTQSAAFGASTRVVRVSPDAICSVEIGGANPVATAASSRMAADSVEYYFVKPGDKLAVITNS